MADETDSKKIPRTVQNAIASFDAAERAQMFADSKNHEHRNAVLRMSIDPTAKDWEAFYADETEKILREYDARRARQDQQGT